MLEEPWRPLMVGSETLVGIGRDLKPLDELEECASCEVGNAAHCSPS
jgi:hypothetical protein